MLTSVAWQWEVYYSYLINSVIDATFTTRPYYGGLAEGMVEISPLNEKLSTYEIERAVSAARVNILSGETGILMGFY